MGQPSSKDEMTIRHQFDRLCQMALKGEAVNYYKHMDYRRKHEERNFVFPAIVHVFVIIYSFAF